MSILEAYNLNFSYDNNTIFNNITLKIKEGSFVNIYGRNGVGKTTLLKLLSGSIITDSNIKVDKIKINKFNMDVINNKIAFISSNNKFFSKTVLDEILLEKNEITDVDVSMARKLLDDFNLSSIEGISPLDLSYAENQIVGVIKFMIKKPKVLFIDNAFSRFDYDKKTEILEFIKKYALKNNITVIYASNNLDDIYLFDRVIVLKNKEIYLDADPKTLLNDDRLLDVTKKLPFIEELSRKLIMYNLISKKYDNVLDLAEDLLK
ncbi:MAG: energy-coupling factor ABC transporter ATP-binding protein [Bacilli bacterium]|nr:energy-coupling factor ABC transporter ATP-binding protein [Bacilli bacterium]